MSRNMDDLAYDIVNDIMDIYEGADNLTKVDVEDIIIDITHRIQDNQDVLYYIVPGIKESRLNQHRCPRCGQELEVEEYFDEIVENWGTPTSRKASYKHCDCGYKQW